MVTLLFVIVHCLLFIVGKGAVTLILEKPWNFHFLQVATQLGEKQEG